MRWPHGECFHNRFESFDSPSQDTPENISPILNPQIIKNTPRRASQRMRAKHVLLSTTLLSHPFKRKKIEKAHRISLSFPHSLLSLNSQQTHSGNCSPATNSHKNRLSPGCHQFYQICIYADGGHRHYDQKLAGIF